MDERDDYQEFLNKLQKRGSKPYKLGHCFGARDAFRWIRKNKWKALDGKPCDKLLYSKIISSVNQELVESLLDGHQVELPHQMGTLLLSRMPSWVKIVDGEVKTNYWTDWKKTLEYMYEDKEAREKHSRIRRINSYIYRIRYSKSSAHFQNRYFYKFRPNRSLKKALQTTVEKQKMYAEQREFY